MILPSQVRLHAGNPLVDTLGKTELECAAGLIVQYCAASGDRWEPIDVGGMLEWIRGEAKSHGAEPGHWSRNPFFRPDFQGLGTAGFAELTWSDESPQASLTKLRLLPLFFERLEAQQAKFFGWDPS
jgi:hypothetical protein